jgi:N-hydroxyarylamine O-acetyltransferase
VSQLNLDAYFARIGYQGPRAPTLETLAAIHLRHAETIPFENLDPFLRRPFRLDIASLQQKLVEAGRGGYCFEHNLLLSHVLRELGFEVTELAARVLWTVTDDKVRPRSHMVLLVNVEGRPYVADVGFGGLTLTAPLRLEADIEQTTPHETFRLLRADEDFVMQASIDGNWNALYRFDLQKQFLADYEVSSWYLSNHPDSFFVTGLIAARPDRDCRYALHNHKLSVHHLGGGTEQFVLTTAAELRMALQEKFQLVLEDVPELDAGLERLLTASGAWP